jgi:hypothetical protein
MRRYELLLWCAVLFAGCAAEEGGGTEARARELMAPTAPAVAVAPDVARGMQAPPRPQVHAPPPSGDEVAPERAPAAGGAVDAPSPGEPPAPAKPGVDLPGDTTPRPTVTEEPGKVDTNVTMRLSPSGDVVPPSAYVVGPPSGQVTKVDGSWAGRTPDLPSDDELDREGTPGCGDLRPLGTAEQLAMDFPWGKGEDGNWQGTGTPDAEPLRKVPDAEILAAALDRRPDAETRNNRLSALVSIGRRHLPAALSVLGSTLNDPDTFVRRLALSGLVEHGGPGALPHMWRAFRDNAPEVRGAAVWAIALYGTDEALKAIDAGLADPDPGVRGMAVLATTAVRDMSKVWPILETAAQSDEQRLYQEAAYVLSSIESRHAMEMLAQTLKASTDPLKRRTFAHYLKVARRNNPHLLVAPTAQR